MSPVTQSAFATIINSVFQQYQPIAPVTEFDRGRRERDLSGRAVHKVRLTASDPLLPKAVATAQLEKAGATQVADIRIVSACLAILGMQAFAEDVF